MSTLIVQYPSTTTTNPSTGTNGATAPTSSTEVAGINPSGNLQPLQTDAFGNLFVNVSSATSINGTVAISQVTSGTTNNVTLSSVGSQSAIPITGLPNGSLKTTDPQNIFDDTFAPSGVLDTTNRWNTPVSSGTGVAAVVVGGGGAITLGTGNTANSYSSLTSQPTFPQKAPGFIETYHAVNLEFPITANSYRFWGQGTLAAAPTAAAPLTDAIGFEVATTGKMYAIAYSAGARGVIGDLSTGTGNSTQPQDSGVHKYFCFFRGDLAFFCIDKETNIVATMATGALGPINNTLPVQVLAISGSTPPVSNVVLTDNAVFVGDTTNSSNNISDGTYSWRKANVDVNSNLAVIHPDIYTVGAGAQTATVNNIISSTSGTAATDTLGYKTAMIQVVSTGTGGTFIFEGSNDNVNFQTLPVYNQLITTGTLITAAITATSSQIVYTAPLSTRYLRLRIATTITGGNIQAFTKLSQQPFVPATVVVAQATASSLQTTVTPLNSTVSTFTSVVSSASGQVLLALNTSRKGMTVFNESSSVLYLKLGTSASFTSYTVQMPANSYYELPFFLRYTGEVDGLWSASSSSGNARIMELT